MMMLPQSPYTISIDAIEAFVHSFLVPLARQKPPPILLFKGPLGAGKSTLCRHVIEQLGVEGPIQSPTFSYVHEYIWEGGSIAHFDLYRLPSAAAFFGAGFGEYLDEPQTLVLIEWPEILLPYVTAVKLKKCVLFELFYGKSPEKERILITRELTTSPQTAKKVSIRSKKC